MPATFDLVETLLQPVLPVITDVGDRSIISAGFRVIVTPGCSGVAGFVLAVAVVFSALVFCRREYRFARALLLLPASVAVVYVLNGVRIAVLFLVGHWGAPVVAVRAFHSQAGWLVFNIAIAMLLKSFATSSVAPKR